MGERTIKTRREEYSDATRGALVASGREAFLRDGFHVAAVDAISKAARVTRGAFYHHFADKKALFDEVVVAMQAEATRRVEATGRSEDAIWDRTIRGIGAYLDVCRDPAYLRIVLHDAPTVLGALRFRQIEEAYPLALLSASLRTLAKKGEIEAADVDLLTQMLDAMICRLALLIAEAGDPDRLAERGRGEIALFLEAHRRRQRVVDAT